MIHFENCADKKKKLLMESFSIRLLLLDFLLALSSILIVSNSLDSISTTQILSDDGTTIVSAKGSFEMGFFSPQGSSNRYMGIWYYNILPKAVVWVANRDFPFNDTSGVLRITQQGNLTLSSNATSANRIVWSSNSSSYVQNPVAQLLDTGNLVVRNASDADPNNYTWQSFDFPGDTLMPGVKLGVNFLSGLNRMLSSGKSSTDLSRGQFTWQFVTQGYPQNFVMNGSQFITRSGPWNGLRFSGLPGLKPNPIYTFHYLFNQEEVSYWYELVDPTVYSRLVLLSNGLLQRHTWNNRTQDWTISINVPSDNCDNYALCGDNGICSFGNSPTSCSCLDKFEPKNRNSWDSADWSDGCVRKTSLDCAKGDGFIMYSGLKLPDTRFSWYNETMTLNECQQVCLKNCSCMGYTNLNISNGGSGCLLWIDTLIDMRSFSENGQDIYIRMASSELATPTPAGSTGKKGKKIQVILGVLAGLLLLGVILIFYAWNKRTKNHQQQQQQQQQQMEGGAGYGLEQSYHGESRKEDLELPLFDLETIVMATDNFSLSGKIGEGGFGPVYKGELEDGQEIAVKRLSKYSAQGLNEFKNEVICIAKLQHRNLVKLLGCCIQGAETMLIYEYLPNNSLDYFIFDEKRRVLLDWPKRLNIINGIARGLLYLHQDSRLRIIHRDLKAGNILLDSNLNPKISDFGMARSFGGNETEGNTKRVVGTYGYMSPEYAVDGLFSIKSDVFSFGVLVLEIVSGQKNRGFIHPHHHHNLLGHSWLLFREVKAMELIDPCLSNTLQLSELLRSIHIALLCVQQNPEDRPSMSTVVLMLASEGPLPNAKEPGFFTQRNLFFEPTSSGSRQTVSTSNELSITQIEPR